MDTRFIVPKEKERAEVLLQKGVGGFQFKKGETYVFKYSFRAKDGMRVSGSSTRFGQMKGVSDGFQLLGNPLFSVTANNNGINVRFNNQESDKVDGMDEFLSWEDATGEWIHVQITTTFGKSMEVSIITRDENEIQRQSSSLQASLSVELVEKHTHISMAVCTGAVDARGTQKAMRDQVSRKICRYAKWQIIVLTFRFKFRSRPSMVRLHSRPWLTRVLTTPPRTPYGVKYVKECFLVDGLLVVHRSTGSLDDETLW